ncbi:hypothetical protein P168DRAFT_13694 [Aspergillus campestris IBT 28561]|uniref:Uncharacterized protein n=1 Tax=Aspergillus campestris (strain IBT 28561) TaxID=1392248 RepID=A0A2I1DEM7_ASPC2|nr:uncharacterized protein P168DRAFT_13694 [Aspergillus campestris IBT 28561]PKY08316.1 hypothetical protein P168DRAFT_13694 [Aspergillus campestris IBT 28561]
MEMSSTMLGSGATFDGLAQRLSTTNLVRRERTKERRFLVFTIGSYHSSSSRGEILLPPCLQTEREDQPHGTPIEARAVSWSCSMVSHLLDVQLSFTLYTTHSSSVGNTIGDVLQWGGPTSRTTRKEAMWGFKPSRWKHQRISMLELAKKR